MCAAFTTTQWTMVVSAGADTGTEARAALEQLCQAYWLPLYSFARGRGRSPDEAADLTQAFFAELLEKRSLKQVDRSKGLFRSFLLASFQHFLSHERDKARAQKRGGATQTISLDWRDGEDRLRHEPIHQLDPEDIFERRWGLTLLERAMERLEEQAERTNPRRFELLRPFLTGAEPKLRYREVARELGVSEGTVKSAVHRLRRSYGQLLRQEVAATVADSHDVDDEIRHLLAVVRPWQAAPSS